MWEMRVNGEPINNKVHIHWKQGLIGKSPIAVAISVTSPGGTSNMGGGFDCSIPNWQVVNGSSQEVT